MTQFSPSAHSAASLTASMFQDICTYMFVDPVRCFSERGPGYILGSAFAPSADLNLLYGGGFSDPEQQTADLLQKLRDWKLPFLWIVSPDGMEAHVSAMLDSQGQTCVGDFPIMTLSLDQLNERDVEVPGLEFQRVQTESQWDAWCRVAHSAFEFSPQMDTVAAAAIRQPALDPDSRAHFFLGLLDGQPVGTALTILGNDVVGVWCVGTASSVRRRGIGAAMTTGPLLAARQAGHTKAILGATPAGFPVYTRLGWNLEYTAPMYLFTPDASAASDYVGSIGLG